MSRPTSRDTITSLPFIARVKEWFKSIRIAKHQIGLDHWNDGKFYTLLQLRELSQEDVIQFETALISWAKNKLAVEGRNEKLEQQVYELECSRELRANQPV